VKRKGTISGSAGKKGMEGQQGGCSSGKFRSITEKDWKKSRKKHKIFAQEERGGWRGTAVFARSSHPILGNIYR